MFSFFILHIVSYVDARGVPYMEKHVLAIPVLWQAPQAFWLLAE
jgi:hypothetical protein